MGAEDGNMNNPFIPKIKCAVCSTEYLIGNEEKQDTDTENKTARSRNMARYLMSKQHRDR